MSGRGQVRVKQGTSTDDAGVKHKYRGMNRGPAGVRYGAIWGQAGMKSMNQEGQTEV